MDDKPEKLALFRYGLIAPLVLDTLPRGELTRRALEIASRLYDIPQSTRRQVSVDTLLDGPCAIAATAFPHSLPNLERTKVNSASSRRRPPPSLNG